MEVSDCHTWK